ncbi:MAG: hypothetical protein N2738_09845, partial [Thermodesulfovibrionales bacterium]|nr:hypothetical protein [Thermodesulfovibrionales bacterium]
MRFRVIHSLPDRLRVNLMIPKGMSINIDKLKGIEGVTALSFNVKTGNLLVRHSGNTQRILEAIKNIPLSASFKDNKGDISDLSQKKKEVIFAGMRLAVSPLLPLPIKTVLTLYGATAFLKKGIRSILNKNLNIDVLDATAIGTAISIGDYKTAGVISFLLKISDYLEEKTKDKSRKMLTSAFKVDDEYVWLKCNGTEIKVKASELK